MQFDLLLLVVVPLVVTVVGRIVAGDIETFVPRLAARLLRAAATRLEPSVSDRYLEEWLAHQEQIPETIGKLWHALSVRYGDARRMARIVGGNPRLSATNAKFVRNLDIIFASSALPGVMMITGILKSLPWTAGGMSMVRTECIGHGGRTFWAYRLRSANQTADTILRRTKFDETPDLISVLLGEMTVMGPRLFPRHDFTKADFQMKLRGRASLVRLSELHGPLVSKSQNADEEENHITDLSFRDYCRILTHATINVERVRQDEER